MQKRLAIAPTSHWTGPPGSPRAPAVERNSYATGPRMQESGSTICPIRSGGTQSPQLLLPRALPAALGSGERFTRNPTSPRSCGTVRIPRGAEPDRQSGLSGAPVSCGRSVDRKAVSQSERRVDRKPSSPEENEPVLLIPTGPRALPTWYRERSLFVGAVAW